MLIRVYNSTENGGFNDNRFYEPIGRFPTIDEDEALYRMLCTEYPKHEEAK